MGTTIAPSPFHEVARPSSHRNSGTSFQSENGGAYAGWVRRYIVFHGKRHPDQMGETEIRDFLTSLAVQRKVAASTQNQALAALLFLYREVLNHPMDWVDIGIRAKRPERLPVILTRDEVRRVLLGMAGVSRLVANLLYGSGLRLMEALELRIKDIDFDRGEIRIRDGKGRKDRLWAVAHNRSYVPGKVMCRESHSDFKRRRQLRSVARVALGGDCT